MEEEGTGTERRRHSRNCSWVLIYEGGKLKNIYNTYTYMLFLKSKKVIYTYIERGGEEGEGERETDPKPWFYF